MFKQFIFFLIILLSSLGTTTIIHNSMAIAEHDNTDQYTKYVDNMANNNSQNSQNSASNILQIPSAISPIQQLSADSPLIFYGNDSSMISQAIGNSPELTALKKQPDNLTTMEKITKLKTQWLSQLP